MDRFVSASRRPFLQLLCLILICAACAPGSAAVPSAPASPSASSAPVYTPAPLLSLVVSAPTGTPTATPVPTHTPAPTPEPTPDGLLGGRFDGFSYTGQVITDSEYRSEHICIQVYHASDSTSYKGYIDYHVADIHLQDITLLKTGSAGPDFTSPDTAKVGEMAEKYGAIWAVSGDYCSVNNGIVIRNGQIYHQQKPQRDICVLYRDGSMRTLTQDEYTVEDLLAQDPWQVFNFGPGLLDADGKAKKSLYLGVSANQNNPRCVLGYYEPGHYALCLIDGRQVHRSRGLDIHDLAKFAENMGFAAAFNLDGGNSAVMVWQGQVYNVPSSPGGRGISDILYLLPEGDPSA
ncbi:MAG: phosphodiester glycosidase family protein [Clostridia bacterium]|nr:phosphodiester glycosidase family protein [Clostridia bacterium]